jgi:hypothetical protein
MEKKLNYKKKKMKSRSFHEDIVCLKYKGKLVTSMIVGAGCLPKPGSVEYFSSGLQTTTTVCPVMLTTL